MCLGGDLDLLLGERDLDLRYRGGDLLLRGDLDLCPRGDLSLLGERDLYFLYGDLDLSRTGDLDLSLFGDIDFSFGGDLDFYLTGERERLFSKGFPSEGLFDFLEEEDDDLAITLDFSLVFPNGTGFSGLVYSISTFSFYSYPF